MSILITELVSLPGPADYTIKSEMFHGPTAIMSSRTYTRDKNFNPGPGQYYPKPILKSSGSAIIAGKYLDNREKSNGPGPGKYNLQEGIPQRGGSMTFRAPAQRPQVGPGPGQYNLQSFTTHVKGGTMASRPTSQIQSYSPGPQRYNPNYRQSSPCQSIRIRLDSTKIPITPGPGQYDTARQKSPVKGGTMGRRANAKQIVVY